MPEEKTGIAQEEIHESTLTVRNFNASLSKTDRIGKISKNMKYLKFVWN